MGGGSEKCKEEEKKIRDGAGEGKGCEWRKEKKDMESVQGSKENKMHKKNNDSEEWKNATEVKRRKNARKKEGRRKAKEVSHGIATTVWCFNDPVTFINYDKAQSSSSSSSPLLACPGRRSPSQWNATRTSRPMRPGQEE